MEGGDVGRWVLEFLLRNPLLHTNLIKKVIRTIPFSDADSRLKKTLLLKTLQDHLSTVSIAEPILEALELLEELHRCDASPVTAAMSAAYCAVAVECTLKYLQLELHHNNPAYLSAVNRIWRGRIRHMNGSGSGSGEGSLLLSEELKRWRSDIEASLSDSQVREGLVSIDSRRDAIIKLRVYLAEAWANLGPSFLQVAASMHARHLEAQHQEREIQKCRSAAAEQVHLSTTIEVQKVGECGSLEMQMIVRDSLLNSSEVNEEAHVEKQSTDANVPCPNSINNNEADLMEKHQTSFPQSCDHRPSLMERNTTARVYEWDDLIDGLHGGTSNHESRFHLPSPKGRKLSPLKKYESPDFTKRRKKKKWSQLEEETLKTAVDKFGRGNWKLILNSHKDIFEERTEVDLKDKWRNMTRYGWK
ncbi:Telomeric repeat-binding factor 1 [Spatholobus suberectus]|nr:Telomeric repeat-binding factor 1 [Spatholobus suberectus]